MGEITALKESEIVEYLFLGAYKNSGNQLLVCHGLVLQTVRHNIVDILDEDDVGIKVVEVLNKRSVTTRTEKH